MILLRQDTQMIEEMRMKSGRNYGIDLLRLLSMLYVVMLHVLGHGGVLNTAAEGTAQYQCGWFLEMWAYCAVDIFAVISGYVGYSDKVKRYHFSNYLVMWLQVVAYGAVITLLFYLVDPDLVTRKDFRDMFFPVTNNLYWYFTAYTGLFLLIPLLNAALRQFSKITLRKLFIGLLLLFSVFDKVVNCFVLNRGYSFVWLLILYLLGAIIRKCDIGQNMSSASAFAGIVLCCMVSYLWKLYGIEFEVLNITVNRDFFESYVSPTHVCAAILHVVLFSKIKCNDAWKKIIAFSAPGAFAVYLVNEQKFVREYMMMEKFTYLAESPVYILILHVVGTALAFLVISVVMDHIRQRLFGAFKVKDISTYITEGFIGKLEYWADKLL